MTFNNKSFNSRVIALFLLMFIGFGCQVDDPEPDIPQFNTSYKHVNSNDIPGVISKLQQYLGLGNSEKPYSKGLGHINTDFGKIKFKDILEVIDTLENANYTFSVTDKDKNPFTFTNLIIRKTSDANIEPPYLLSYEVDSASMNQFVYSGFSMDSFSGSITKSFLTNDYFKREGSANLEGKSSTVYCDPIVSNVTGQNSNPQSPTADQQDTYTSDNSAGADSYAQGDPFTPPFQTNCIVQIKQRLISSSEIGESTASYRPNGYDWVYVVTWECTDESNHTSVNDSGNCPEQLSDEVGVIFDEINEELAVELVREAVQFQLFQALYDFENNGTSPINHQDWNELFEILELVFIEYGLIDVIPIVGEAHEFIQSFDHFVAGNVDDGLLKFGSAAIGLVPVGKGIKALGRMNDLRKAFFALRTFFKNKKYFKRIGIAYGSFSDSFKAFTVSNYRHNLKAYTKIDAPSNVHAHHIFPQEFESRFRNIDQNFNIHNPANMSWWESSDHLSNASEYNSKWAQFFADNPLAGITDVKKFGKDLMRTFNIPTDL